MTTLQQRQHTRQTNATGTQETGAADLRKPHLAAARSCRRVCVVTCYAAANEPRAPRHAIAARLAFPDAEIVFIDMAPGGRERIADHPALAAHGITRRTIEYPTRTFRPWALAGRRLAAKIGAAAVRAGGPPSQWSLGSTTIGLSRQLMRVPADLYIAHNIETLPAAAAAAATTGAALFFDCMEFYSDMGDSQTRSHARSTSLIERRWLPECRLVLASSDELADALVAEYGIARPLASYNVPPLLDPLPSKPQRSGTLDLYWRNGVIGFGQRGLEDALSAMTLVPDDVRLFLQGRPPFSGLGQIMDRISSLGLDGRVIVLPPFAPHEAVAQAARYDVGLCLERSGPRNHALTVSNKMFDYHMAGLAVISSDMPSLAAVVARSGGGVVYKAGDPRSLADAIITLRNAPDLLANLQSRARRFAVEDANLEREIERLAAAFRGAVATSKTMA